ncbi:MAG: type VI secretion system tip protein VgrG, partial [Polyangiaceae bacterium]|nr:type VI secretion system tip protein VgrG [Polyangiaceae bacterium]
MLHDNFSLLAPDLGEGLRVLAFRGTEAISTSYRFEVFFLGEQKAIDEAAAAVGSGATLQVNGADGSAALAWRGIVEAVEIVEAHGERALYRVELRPRLHRLTHEVHSRIWVDKDVPAIVKELLDAATVGHSMALDGTYTAVEHIGQYHETDFDFVSRRLEREGIHYYFDHEGD